MKKTIIIILLFLIASPALAYYNPGAPTGFVNDYANIIEDGLQQEMENKLTQFEQESSNEISVVTIQNLDGDYIENFAEKLFAEWGIGKEDKNNGVLVLVALEDREMRIEVGYGLEGALTDAQSNWIINNEMKPAFKEERYGDGINEAVDKIISATKGEYISSELGSPITNGESDSLDWSFIFWIVIFGFLWLAAILGRSKSWWAGGVIGGVAGIIIGLIKGFLWLGLGAIAILIPFGLLFDFIVSKKYHAAKSAGHIVPWWIGGGRGGGRFGGGGFGGFGGGMSGGGGSSGSW
ncbi:MAG: TPM domain-containing protein [Patescibacteria group bacterium]